MTVQEVFSIFNRTGIMFRPDQLYSDKELIQLKAEWLNKDKLAILRKIVKVGKNKTKPTYNQALHEAKLKPNWK
jgi:hypothetical protein